MKKALEPLRELRLVSVAKVEGLEAKATHYKLRLLEGARPFKVESRTLADVLVNEWCYVLRPAGSTLSLAPIVRLPLMTVMEPVPPFPPPI